MSSSEGKVLPAGHRANARPPESACAEQGQGTARRLVQLGQSEVKSGLKRRPDHTGPTRNFNNFILTLSELTAIEGYLKRGEM